MADFVAYNDMMEVCSTAGEEYSQSGLIPSLPDDVFLNCLVRVPLKWHANLQRVSKNLRSLVQSAEYYEQRKTEGTSNSFVCMLQPMPMSTDASTEMSSALSNTVYGISLLDVQSMAWERLPAIPGLPGGLPTFAKLVAVKGELVVLGGWWQSNSWEPSKAVFVYNFSSQTWRQGVEMPSVRSFFACGALGSRVLVAGGHDGDKKALASVEAYDVETNSWLSLPSMRLERDEPTGVAMDGRFFVLSGYGSESQGVFTKSGEVYDSSTNAWSFVDDMWTRGAADAGVANPSSLAAMAGDLYGVLGKEVVVYSRERNAWTVVEKVPEECEKGEITSSSITATGNSLVITGLVKRNETAALRTLRLTPAHGSSKAQWQTIACNDQFSNLAQTSCAFEL